MYCAKTFMLEDKTPDTIKLLNRVIFILAIVGIAMAAYVLQSFLRQSQVVCLTGEGCALVRKSPLSYPMGIPVPAIGLVGYSALAALAFLRTTSDNRNLLKAMLGITVFGVGFVAWFTYTEVFLIKGVCTWCVLSAVNMVVLFVLTVRSMMLTRNPPRTQLEE